MERQDGPSVDPTLVERVEVVRGPASVLYGADNNREVGLGVRGGGATGPWGWRATATGHVAEALHTPEGELDNTGFGAFNAEAAAVRRGSWGSVTARLVHHGGEFKLLEEDGPPEGVDEGMEGGPERKLSDQRLQLLGNFPLRGQTRLETRVQAQRHDIIEMEDDPEALARGEFVEVAVFDLTLNTLLGEALLHHALLPGTSGTVGVTGRLQSSATGGVIPVVPGADKRSATGASSSRPAAAPSSWTRSPTRRPSSRPSS